MELTPEVTAGDLGRGSFEVTNCGDTAGTVMLAFALQIPNGPTIEVADVPVKLGAGYSSAKTKGNVFERFRIEGNRIYRSPTAKLNESFKACICYNGWAGEDRLNQTVIRGNRVYVDGTTKPLVVIQRQNQSVGLVVTDNTVHPYTPPPRAEAP